MGQSGRHCGCQEGCMEEVTLEEGLEGKDRILDKESRR